MSILSGLAIIMMAKTLMFKPKAVIVPVPAAMEIIVVVETM